MLTHLFQLLELIGEQESESMALCALSFQNDRDSELPARLFAVICEMSLQKTQQKVIINLVQLAVSLHLQTMQNYASTSGQISV